MQENYKTEIVPGTPLVEGFVSEGIVSYYVAPKSSASFLDNFHNDTLGFATARRPFVSRNTPTAPVLSCALYQSAGGSPLIVWQQGIDLRYADVLGTGSIVSHNNFMATTKVRYDTIQGQLIYTPNGVGQPKLFNTASPNSISGTTFPTSPSLDLISAGFSGRVWMSGSNDALNRVYYTEVIPAGGIASVTGGSNFLTINANNGDKITGFARLQSQNTLAVFTHNGIFRIANTQSQDNTPLANVGVFQQEAIVKAKSGFYFYHPSGVFFLGSSGLPQEVSAKIRDFIQRVPNLNQPKVFGWADDDHVFFCLGNGLVGMQVNKTYYIRYTISTQVWSTMSSINFLPTCADHAFFNGSTTVSSLGEDVFPTNYIIGSDTNEAGTAIATYRGGTFNVYNAATENSAVTSDWGVFPVHVDYQTPWMNFSDLIPEVRTKLINGLGIPHENGAGLKVAYQVNKDPKNQWREIGQLDAEYMTLFMSWQSVLFNRIKFRVYGDTKGVGVKVGVPTALRLDNQGYEHN